MIFMRQIKYSLLDQFNERTLIFSAQSTALTISRPSPARPRRLPSPMQQPWPSKSSGLWPKIQTIRFECLALVRFALIFVLFENKLIYVHVYFLQKNTNIRKQFLYRMPYIGRWDKSDSLLSNRGKIRHKVGTHFLKHPLI